MDSDGDEDFVVSAPTKKTKKNEKADGEEKGKKKKGSATKGERVSTSPKRKTPKGKKKEDKEESKKEKKGKGKAKGKKASEEPEEAEPAENGEGGDDDLGSFNPGDTSAADEDFSAGGSDADEDKSKKKKEKKAPKGKKDKGGAKGADEEEILDYLKKQNRPYSLQNIYDNLHAKIKKGACQKALDNLVDEGDLQVKEFGKAKLYLLNQQNIPQVSTKEMDKLKESMNSVKQEHTKLAEEVKEMGQYLKSLSSQLTNEQLDEEIEKYKQLVEEDKKKLEIYESGNYPKISDEDMKKAEDKKKKFETEFKKRKRMCLDMLNSIADFMEQKLTNVMESVGIEVD